MPSDAYRRYYEKNREAIVGRMRELSARVREERRQYLAEHPEEMEAQREKYREKYYNCNANKNRRQLEEWIDLPEVKEEAKAFFRLMIAEEGYRTLTRNALKQIYESMNIRASIPNN
jgi:hypothetical protein